MNINDQNWGNAAFAAFNAIAASWAIIAYIGIGNLLTDIWLGLTSWLYVDIKPTQQATIQADNSQIDWKAVLYHGENTGKVPHVSLKNLVVKSVEEIK